MFNKKFSLFLITIAFMLSLSAVSAVDGNSTDDMIAGDVEEEPPSGDVEILSTTEDSTSKAVQTEENYALSGSDVNLYYKSGSGYEVKLSQGENPVSGATVDVNIVGKTYHPTTDENGVAVLPIGLNVGTYAVTASYDNVSVNAKVKVLPVVKASDVKVPYNTKGKFTATFLNGNGKPLANTNVKFTVVGKTYTSKTNSKGVAVLNLGLNPGKYVIYSIHPNGYKISNTITVVTTVSASNFNKYYGNTKKFSATFYDKNGKALSNKKVKFKAHGNTFTSTTNSKGVAYLGIISKPSKFTVTAINPVTGQKVSKTVQVLSTISAGNVNTFTYLSPTFKVTLKDKNGKAVANKYVKITTNGVTKSVKTDSKGVASLALKYTKKGTYKITCRDPNNGYTITKYAYVKWATLKASAMSVKEGSASTFKVTLTNQDKKVVPNAKVQITVNGVTSTVKTDSKGVASLNFVLPHGSYVFTVKDPSTGYSLKAKVTVVEVKNSVYDKYGVSSDGKKLLAVGRPSASGELSKYGYKFYITEFVRECPYCHSKELYWGIFWAGNEVSNYGVFPATGNKEGGSAEGHIFCAHCDSDWSVFGNNHGGSGGDLTIITPSKLTTKDVAYALLSGNYVFS